MNDQAKKILTNIVTLVNQTADLDTCPAAISEESCNVWNILTALRSYDDIIINKNTIITELFKNLTTSRLRAIIGFKSQLFDCNPQPLTTEQIKKRNQLLYNLSHFRTHFIAGMESAKILGFQIPDEELDFSIGIGENYDPK